jgi:hypothetical protein
MASFQPFDGFPCAQPRVSLLSIKILPNPKLKKECEVNITWNCTCQTGYCGARKICSKFQQSWSYITFFLHILFFGVKEGNFTINYFFLYVTKAKTNFRKMEKIFVSKEKSFIGSAALLSISSTFYPPLSYESVLRSFPLVTVFLCVFGTRISEQKLLVKC